MSRISHAFGIIGAGNAAIIDALAYYRPDIEVRRQDYTQFIAMHHEQAAVMAAATFYRTSRRLSAAIVTTGAGSSNALTGALSAYMDSTPVLIISGNEHSQFCVPGNERTWGVQGYDSVAAAKGMVKEARRVMRQDDLAKTLHELMHIAISDRPGPVWCDIPMDLQA